MTYKSTIDALRAHIASGDLVQFVPNLRHGEAVNRGLYVTPAIDRWLSERPNDQKGIEYKAFVRARLGMFVKGNLVDNRFYMKRLKKAPIEIWEIRINAAPKARVFGMFVFQDCFVCTNMRTRDDLGPFDAAAWTSAKRKTERKWDELFPGMRPWSGTHFSHYVTEKGVHYDW